MVDLVSVANQIGVVDDDDEVVPNSARCISCC